MVKLLLFVVLTSDTLAANFSNSAFITINDTTNPPTKSSPYPSGITVSGLSGVVAKVSVQLNSFSHAFPDDVDIVLVSPDGQNSVVMSNVGGGHPGATNLTFTLDDDAPTTLPYFGPFTSGTFKPTKRLSTFDFAFPTPAPATPGDASFSVFKGSNPNGVWNLFVIDDTSPDGGSISGGWTLSIATAPVRLSIQQADTNVLISWTNALTGFTLQTAVNESGPWTNATPAPTLISDQYVFTNAASGSCRFYRLVK